MGKGVVVPFEDGVEGPADLVVVAVADDLAHELPVLGARHGEVVPGNRGYLQESRGDKPTELEGSGYLI